MDRQSSVELVINCPKFETPWFKASADIGDPPQHAGLVTAKSQDLAISTFSPVGSLSLNGLRLRRVCACVHSME